MTFRSRGRRQPVQMVTLCGEGGTRITVRACAVERPPLVQQTLDTLVARHARGKLNGIVGCGGDLAGEGGSLGGLVVAVGGGDGAKSIGSPILDQSRVVDWMGKQLRNHQRREGLASDLASAEN